MPAMIGAMLRVLVIALVLLVGVMFATKNLLRPPPYPESANYFETPLELPVFALTDATGRPFSTDALRGRFSLMFFGFTNCPDICPLTLAALASAQRELEQSGDEPPAVVFVSVDPNRDTPEQITRYLENFDPEFTGVTGHQDELQPLLSALGVSVMIFEHPAQPSYSVTHNGTIYVIGPGAELIATMSGSPAPATIATDFARIENLYRRRPPAATPAS
jgi:protein SCO1/2